MNIQEITQDLKELVSYDKEIQQLLAVKGVHCSCPTIGRIRRGVIKNPRSHIALALIDIHTEKQQEIIANKKLHS